jgi:hypothetical protein
MVWKRVLVWATAGLALAAVSGYFQARTHHGPVLVVGIVASVFTVTLCAGGILDWRVPFTPSRVAEGATKKTLEQRLDELSASMRASAQIVHQVSTELDARAATAKRLRDEARTAEAISRLHREESEAVRRMLDAQLETVARKIHSDSVRIGIASFVAGSGVTVLITLLVHPLG